jgi:hypothetical protein
MKKCHGSYTVVQYLKGSHLAIQKYIAGEPIGSLKELIGPGFYPCLRHGLPKFIPLADRNLIRSKDASIIRYYLTIFSLYRVLDCPRTLKLSTITKPFEGSEEYLNSIIELSDSIIKKHLKKKILNSFKPLEKFLFLETSSNPGVEKTS